MATLQDIADAVGVSKAAVSRILNHKGSFSAETIAHVEEAARRLGYVLPTQAVQPTEEDFKLISAIFPPIGSPYFGILAAQLEREAAKYGYGLVLNSSLFSRERIEDNIRYLEERHISGIVILSFADYQELATASSLPIVSVGNKVVEGISSVHSDDLAAGRLAARHLLSRGAHEFVYLSGNPYGVERDQRYQGFAEVLGEAGIQPAAYHVTWTEAAAGGTANVVTQMVMDHPHADGVFAESQTASMECLSAYLALGYRVPEDVKIVGYGYPYLSRYSYPRLTVVSENTDAIARRAIELLMERIEGEDGVPVREITVPVALEVYQTT